MTTTIKPTSWADQGDGTAWLAFDRPPVVELGGTSSIRWHELDRTCDSCGGDGLEKWQTSVDEFDSDRCPDCINGRHTLTIDVEHDTNECQIGSCRGQDSDLRYGVHRLRVSVVPDMILPLVDEAAVIHGRVGMPAKCITVRHDAAHIHDGATVPGRLHLFPPDAKPGGFAVLVNWRPASRDATDARIRGKVAR